MQSMGNHVLGTMERHLMTIIRNSGNSISGYDLREAYGQVSGRYLSIGQLYSTLERLETKGFVYHETVAGDEARGGRRQRLFALGGIGQQALSEAENLEINLAKFRLGLTQCGGTSA